MHPITKIDYISRKDIDTNKWDKCIHEADNGLIYAQSFYLDTMALHWDALVMGDYKIVMPLTWNKKHGFYYLYQPFLCASLGVFGNNLDASVLTIFLKSIPPRFKYWDIYLNAGNNFQCQDFNLQQRTNYILPLHQPYEIVYENFRPSYKQLLKRFDNLGYEVSKSIDVEEVMTLAKEQLNPLFRVKQEDYINFSALFTSLRSRGKAESYGVYDQNKQLLASGLFLFDQHRAYYILAGNHPNGRTLGASHAMLNHFIRQHCSSPLILDFEGSDVSKIAFFFKGFGATELYYPGLRYNKLPVLVRWLKK